MSISILFQKKVLFLTLFSNFRSFHYKNQYFSIFIIEIKSSFLHLFFNRLPIQNMWILFHVPFCFMIPTPPSFCFVCFGTTSKFDCLLLFFFGDFCREENHHPHSLSRIHNDVPLLIKTWICLQKFCENWHQFYSPFLPLSPHLSSSSQECMCLSKILWTTIANGWTPFVEANSTPGSKYTVTCCCCCWDNRHGDQFASFHHMIKHSSSSNFNDRRFPQQMTNQQLHRHRPQLHLQHRLHQLHLLWSPKLWPNHPPQSTHKLPSLRQHRLPHRLPHRSQSSVDISTFVCNNNSTDLIHLLTTELISPAHQAQPNCFFQNLTKWHH